MLLSGRWFWGILSCCSLADKIHESSNYPSNISPSTSSSSLTTSSKKASKSFP